MSQCLAREDLERFIVQYVAAWVVGVDQAVLAMAGVRIEGNVGDHAKSGELLLQGGHHVWHQAIGVIGFFRSRRLAAGVDHREQGQCRNAEGQCPLGCLQQLVQALPFDSRHGGDRLGTSDTSEHEHRVDQVIDVEARLARQATGSFLCNP